MRTIGDLSAEERKTIYLAVIKAWGKMPLNELAKEVNVKISVLQAIVGKLRKMGIPLPKAMHSSWITSDVVKEFQAAFNARG